MSNIDWPLTFKGFETFLTPLADASWPIGIAAIFWMFRADIRALLPRIRSFKGAGVEAELHGESLVQDAGHDIIPLRFGTEFPPPHDVFTPLDQYLRDILDRDIGGDDEKKLAWAIRVRSVSEASRLHEANFRMMFGSQLKALRVLNNAIQAPASDFERFFEEAKSNADFAAIHEGRSFEEWGQFMLQTGYVQELADTDPPEVGITPFGRHFLVWITEARVIDYRPG